MEGPNDESVRERGRLDKEPGGSADAVPLYKPKHLAAKEYVGVDKPGFVVGDGSRGAPNKDTEQED